MAEDLLQSVCEQFVSFCHANRLPPPVTATFRRHQYEQQADGSLTYLGVKERPPVWLSGGGSPTAAAAGGLVVPFGPLSGAGGGNPSSPPTQTSSNPGVAGPAGGLSAPPHMGGVLGGQMPTGTSSAPGVSLGGSGNSGGTAGAGGGGSAGQVMVGVPGVSQHPQQTSSTNPASGLPLPGTAGGGGGGGGGRLPPPGTLPVGPPGLPLGAMPPPGAVAAGAPGGPPPMPLHGHHPALRGHHPPLGPHHPPPMGALGPIPGGAVAGLPPPRLLAPRCLTSSACVWCPPRSSPCCGIDGGP